MGARRLLSLIQGLAPDSAFARAVIAEARATPAKPARTSSAEIAAFFGRSVRHPEE